MKIFTTVLLSLFSFANLSPSMASDQTGPGRVKKACYTLENAEEIHKSNPRSFSIPRSDQRRNLPVGQTVKLIFEPCIEKGVRRFSERMWVKITRKDSSGYAGELDNAPAGIDGLELGDSIKFGPEHVIAFIPTKTQLDLPFGQSLLVSPEILASGDWPALARRVSPAKAGDSGWRIYSSSETTPSSKSPLTEVSVDELIAKFQILDSILDEPHNTAWRWNETEHEYAPIKR